MPATELSGPLPPEQFTQTLYSRHHGTEYGIRDDRDGSAFGITLPPSGNDATFGSATIDSICKVAGYPLIIPKTTPHSLEIPPALTGGTTGRTDLVVARYAPATYTTAPGPVRLFRIAGTPGSLTIPAHTPGTDLPLWGVRRKQGEALNQAIPIDMRSWTGIPVLVKSGAPLPLNAQLGARATRDGITYRRDFVGSTVDWVQETTPREVLTGTGVATDGDDWDVVSAARLSREGVKRWANLIVNLAGDPVNPDPTVDGERRVARLAAADRPAASVPLAGTARNTAGQSRGALGRIDPDGWVVWYWASTTNRFPTGSTITLTGPWELNA